MKEQVVSFKTAKLAKEKGLYIRTKYGYEEGKLIQADAVTKFRRGVLWNFNRKTSNCCSAPTQSLLQKWLREEYKIYVNSIISIWTTCKFTYNICLKKNEDVSDIIPKNDWYYTYEEALEQGLQEALKMI